MKAIIQCPNNHICEVEIKKTKKGYKYYRCLVCGITVGLPKDDEGGFTGCYIDELIKELKPDWKPPF